MADEENGDGGHLDHGHRVSDSNCQESLCQDLEFEEITGTIEEEKYEECPKILEDNEYPKIPKDWTPEMEGICTSTQENDSSEIFDMPKTQVDQSHRQHPFKQNMTRSSSPAVRFAGRIAETLAEIGGLAGWGAAAAIEHIMETKYSSAPTAQDTAEGIAAHAFSEFLVEEPKVSEKPDKLSSVGDDSEENDLTLRKKTTFDPSRKLILPDVVPKNTQPPPLDLPDQPPPCPKEIQDSPPVSQSIGDSQIETDARSNRVGGTEPPENRRNEKTDVKNDPEKQHGKLDELRKFFTVMEDKGRPAESDGKDGLHMPGIPCLQAPDIDGAYCCDHLRYCSPCSKRSVGGDRFWLPSCPSTTCKNSREQTPPSPCQLRRHCLKETMGREERKRRLDDRRFVEEPGNIPSPPDAVPTRRRRYDYDYYDYD